MGNILITSAGRRVSLVRMFQDELKKLLPSAQVFVVDSNPSLSAAAQIANGYFKICKVQDKDYIKELLNLCKEKRITIIIPTIDDELLKLSQNKQLFKENNIEIVVSNEGFIRQSESKRESRNLFEQLGVNTPVLYAKNNYKFPIFIKPERGSSSIGTYVVKEKMQLSDHHLRNENLLFFDYLSPEQYDEFTCDIYFDKQGSIKCVIPRKRVELRGGEVSKSVTRKNLLLKLFEENLNTLKGVRGCVNIQFFVHKETKEVYGIECNPRFGGGFPLSYLAGGNYPKWIIEEYILGKHLEYFNGWEDNLLMLRYDHEVLVHDYEN